MTHKELNKIFHWFGTNAILWILAILGVLGTAWAFNIWIFATWFFTIIYITIWLGAALDSDYASKLPDRPVPSWLSIASDIGLALLMAATGHFFYAALVTIQQLFESDIYRIKERPRSSVE